MFYLAKTFSATIESTSVVSETAPGRHVSTIDAAELDDDRGICSGIPDLGNAGPIKRTLSMSLEDAHNGRAPERGVSLVQHLRREAQARESISTAHASRSQVSDTQAEACSACRNGTRSM